MSKELENIRKKFEALQTGLPQTLPAKVVSVDAETCVLNYDGLEIYDVKLRAAENDNESKILIKPAVDSWVMMSRIGHSKNFYVSMFSEIDSVEIKGKEAQFIFDSIKLNDGSFGGLIKIADLVERLNTVEDNLNMLKALLDGWTPIPQDGGLALKLALCGSSTPPAPGGSFAGSTLTKTKVEDLENGKITHG